MALQFAVVNVQFEQGLNTKIESQYSIPGRLLLLENGVFDRLGSIGKRLGANQLANQVLKRGTFKASQDLSTFDNSLVAFGNNDPASGDNRLVYGPHFATEYSPNIPAWSDPVSAFNNIIREDAIHASSNYGISGYHDTAYLNGIIYVGYREATTNFAIVVAVDSTTGATLWSVSDISSPTHVGPIKLLVLGSKLFVARANASGSIRIQELINLTTSPAFGVDQLLVNDLNTVGPRYDLCVGGSNIYLAYNVNGATQINVNSYDTNVITGTPGTPSPPINSATIADNCGGCVTIWPNSSASVIFVGWANTSAEVHSINYSSTLGSPSANRLHHAPGVAVNNITGGSGSIWEGATEFGVPMVWEVAGSQSYYTKLYYDTILSSDSSGSALLLANSVGLASKVFTVYSGVSAKPYVMAGYSSSLQSAFYLIQIPAPGLSTEYRNTICAKLGYGKAFGYYTWRSLPSVPANSPSFGRDTAFLYAGIKYGAAFSNEVHSPFLTLAQIKFDDLDMFAATEMANGLHLVGGSIGLFDGETYTEHGFHHFVESVSLAQVAGGSMTALGTYSYVVVPEWFDAQGQRHLGPPSIPVNVTLSGGNQSVTVTVAPIKLTNKVAYATLTSTTLAGYQLRLYRTANLGSIYYDTGLLLTPNLTTDTSAFATDTKSDAQINTREVLYTTGGVLENLSLGPCTAIAAYNDRIFVAADEGVYYSKKFRPGQPMAFNDGLFIPTETLGGKPRAVWPFADKLLIFKKDAIYFISGEGPNDLGGGAIFSDPELITSDVGTTNPKSIANTPQGIIFQSDKGFYSLDYGLNLDYIGAPVEYFNNIRVNQAVTLQDKNQVRFFCDISSIGTTLVYDYYAKQWSTFPLINGKGATIWDDDFVFQAGGGGTVHQEAAGVFTNSGSAYALKLRTDWLTFTEVQGLQRVRKLVILGKFKSHHILNVQFAYDYNPKVIDTIQIDTQGAGKSLSVIPDAAEFGSTAFSGTDIYQFRIGLPRQKFESVQITIFDSDQVTPYESFSLSGLAFEVGLKYGAAKLKQAFSQ